MNRQGFEKDPDTRKARLVPFKAPEPFTPHHHRTEGEKKWFTMENQGIPLPPATWKFGVLYSTVATKEHADKAIQYINNTRYVLFVAPFMPVPYQQTLIQPRWLDYPRMPSR